MKLLSPKLIKNLSLILGCIELILVIILVCSNQNQILWWNFNVFSYYQMLVDLYWLHMIAIIILLVIQFYYMLNKHDYRSYLVMKLLMMIGSIVFALFAYSMINDFEIMASGNLYQAFLYHNKQSFIALMFIFDIIAALIIPIYELIERKMGEKIK